MTQRTLFLCHLDFWILLIKKMKNEGTTYSCQIFILLCRALKKKKTFKKTNTNIYYHHFPKEVILFYHQNDTRIKSQNKRSPFQEKVIGDVALMFSP